MFYHKSKLIIADHDKAELFAEILKNRFTGHNNQANDLFHQKVENDILTFNAFNSSVLKNGLDAVRHSFRPFGNQHIRKQHYLIFDIYFRLPIKKD